MDEDATNANAPVAREILDYFLRNPQSADSLLEIARWRLVQENVQRSVEATSAAVEMLVAEGFLQQEMRLGSGRLIQLNPERREEAERFLMRE